MEKCLASAIRRGRKDEGTTGLGTSTRRERDKATNIVTLFKGQSHLWSERWQDRSLRLRRRSQEQDWQDDGTAEGWDGSRQMTSVTVSKAGLMATGGKNRTNAQVAERKFNHGEVRLIWTTLHTQLTEKLADSAYSGDCLRSARMGRSDYAPFALLTF